MRKQLMKWGRAFVLIAMVMNAEWAKAEGDSESFNQFGSQFGGPSGLPPQGPQDVGTFQAAFEVRTNSNEGGKQVKQDCAVCHRLSVMINGKEYGDGEAVTLPKGETHTVKVKDTPVPRDTPPGGDSSPPHTSNQKFTVWPKAVDGQTITSIQGNGPADSPQVFIAKKEEILQYLLDNSEGLMAQDKDWPENPADEPMNKTARLLPMEVAVDANRDGVIQFSGNSTGSEAFDKTEESKPYRFWTNGDQDDKDTEETIPASTPDYADGQIKKVRDLEDFSRLNLYVGGLHEAITQGNIKVGLKWKNTSGGTPSVKVWRNLSPNGGLEYLTDSTVAQQHLALSNPGHVQGTTPYIIPTEFWTAAGLSATQPNAYLLFEGCTKGKGQLVITFHKSDGSEIGEGPGVWLDLVNVRTMYQRVKATGIADNFEEPSQTTSGNPPEPSMGWVDDPNGNPYDASAPKSWEETKQYIVFVHGWNMSYEGSHNFAETMFKRLWQRGYKGRYAFMRWPTLDDSFVGIPYTYNASEYRAWKCGESLKQFVNSLPSGYARNVTAHSMGNIVAGSALQKGMSMANYALLNAAVPAACYDDSSTLDQGWGYTTPHNDPDPATQQLSYRYKLNSVNGRLINFYLPDDDALEKWELNNYTSGPFSLGAKPQRYNGGTTGYYYDPAAALGARLGINFQTVVGRFVTTPHEAMSYVAQSPTKTVGADGRTAGSIGPKVNMFAYGFDDVHSAEFNFTPQNTTAFYNQLLDEFRIPRY